MKVSKSELEKYITNGWTKGRKMNFLEKIYTCPKCSKARCLRPEICSNYQILETMINNFGLNREVIGTPSFYDAYDRVVIKLKTNIIVD